MTHPISHSGSSSNGGSGLHVNAADAPLSIPHDCNLLAMPDAQITSLFRVSLAAVQRWRKEASRRILSRQPTSPTSPGCSASSVMAFTVAAADLLADRPRKRMRADGQTQKEHCSTSSPQHNIMTKSATDTKGATAAAALATGWPTLDAALLGGLRRGWIMELTGPAQSGKTRVAATWCRAIMEDGADCIWLQPSSATRTPFAAFDASANGCSSSSSSGGGGQGQRSMEEALHAACVSDLDALQDLLHVWLRDLSHLRRVGIVVVDSFPDLLRRSFSFGEHDALQRHDALANVSHALKRLAEEARVVVLLITQHSSTGHTSFFQASDTPLSDGLGRTTRSVGHSNNNYDDGGTGDAVQRGVESRSSADVGELGRLFFHNVNVRLRLRTVRVRPSRKSWSAREQWRLEVLKCPLCAPLSIALRAEVQHPSTQSSSDVCSPFLSVSEAPAALLDHGEVVENQEDVVVGCEVLFGALDPWDYTETPTFVYV